MHLYLAAAFTNNYMPGQKYYVNSFTDVERSIADRVPHILESYHYVNKQTYVDEMRAVGAKVFLDSGAFSAFHLGVNIDINAYCDYIIRNRDILRVEDGAVMASVLDGIGDPQKTWENQVYMERYGAPPLPCFHFGEDERYLEYYVKHYPYITIGGMVGKKIDDVIKWLDYVWPRYMLDSTGHPRLKVHAFGITTDRIMERYPWYSVDSSSWIQAASFGNIYVAPYGLLSVSSKSPTRHDAGRHLTTFTAIERQHIESIIRGHGFDPARVAEVYQSRAAFNMMGYMHLNDQLNVHFAECDGVLDCHAVQHLF